MNRPNILITNDDGYNNEGIKALVKAIRSLGNITVVAPASQKSACGHSLTLNRPLRFISVDDDFYKLEDGTPTDCVYLSIGALYEDGKRPDLIISGINEGSNMGEDITYSGTAAGAMEGVLQGIPSIAISQIYDKQTDSLQKWGYELSGLWAYKIAKKILEDGNPLPKKQFLNVNVPPIDPSTCKGALITKMGKRSYGNNCAVRTNPRGEEYWWIGGATFEWDDAQNIGTDLQACANGYVSITPIHLDMTSHDQMQNIKEWLGE